MQITIDTQAEPLLPIIRMLQALHAAQTRKLHTTNDPIDITDDDELEAILTGAVKSGPDHKIEIPGTPADQIYTGEALKASLIEPDAQCDTLPNGDCVSEDPGCMHQPSPEPGFATVEDYVGQAGGSGGGGQSPKSLFDAPLPPCDQTEKVGEATSAPRTAIDDVTVDAAGLPWDERIHSGAKSKLANGNWKLRRGVDPALVASVEAELRGDPQPAAALGAEPAAAPPPAPVAPPPVTAPATSTPAPVAPSAPPTPPAPKPITNAAELVAAVMDKRFTTDQVNAACQAVGVENVASLLAKQDKLPEVLRELGV